MAGRARQILFRIFYSTSFTIVFLLLVAFSCAAPIDSMYQSYKRSRFIDMFLITGVYVVTGLFSLFLYASRLYTNRSILKDIPKTFIPLDKNELPGKRVWRLIEDCRSRSAVIAYQARPRSRRIENELPYAKERINTLLKPEHSKKHQIFEPRWGTIAHPGWSSPASSELPNLEYVKVVSELTDLIEARAVSLAPSNPTFAPPENESFSVSPMLIEILKRPEEFGMRQYIIRLIALGMLEDNSLSTAFLTMYERARFASEPLSDSEFEALMRTFAEVLRNMKPPDLDLIEKHGLLQDAGMEAKSLASKSTNQGMDTTDILQHSPTLLGKRATDSMDISAGSNDLASHTSGEAGSVRRVSRKWSEESEKSDASEAHGLGEGSTSTWTAPTSRTLFASRSTSRRMLASNTGELGPHEQNLRSARSQASMSSGRSGRSQISETGSILRLRPPEDSRENDLPYIIRVPSDSET